MTGPADDTRPVNHVLPAWDLLAGGYGAFALLAAGHSGRLLISGVNARTNDPDLKEALDLRGQTDAELFDCCIDVGRGSPRNSIHARSVAERPAPRLPRVLRDAFTSHTTAAPTAPR